MKSRGSTAAAEEYFPRGKPKGEDKGGGGVDKGATPKEKREGRMVALFGNKENKSTVDKKKKMKKGKKFEPSDGKEKC